jgi:hypothetical protein
MEPDFSGYVTKAGLKCTDGRTIQPDAFKHQDTMTVPLVWHHKGDEEPKNILGHVVLENRDATHAEGAGVYGYGFFNGTEQGQISKQLVQHKDIGYMSIWANQLVEKSKQVFHGMIREVSLVLAGANPGAKIDFVAFQHGDGDVEVSDEEAIITTGLKIDIKHADTSDDTSDASDSSDEDAIRKAYESMNDEQKEAVHYLVGAAREGDVEESAEHSDNSSDDNQSTDEQSTDESATDDLSHQEGTTIVTNVFETKAAVGKDGKEHSLSHDAMRDIFKDAASRGSLKQAVEAYAEANLQHGINDIDMLFPEATLVGAEPEWIKRRTEWVATVLNGVSKRPFSRIKTRSADIRQDDARAKGYIKGNYKKEEWFGVAQRVTTPTTIYKKQRLDRDDILDITDFNVVDWMKGEMRLMWEEEFARAILIGDGRAVDDEDKVRDPLGAPEGAGIRSIANDHEFYVTTVNTELDATPGASWENLVDDVTLARQYYKGSSPTMFTTQHVIARLMLSRDGFGRKVFSSEADLATQLGVSRIVPVEVMEDQGDLVAIIVNLSDYAVGTDRGGELSYFDDFDLDYNQYKYLYEGRMSGALLRYKTAIVIRNADSSADSALLTPTAPTFNAGTGVVTIPTVTGVTYKDAADDSTLTAGAQAALDPGETLEVYAETDSTHHFATGEDDQWSFTRPSA